MRRRYRRAHRLIWLILAFALPTALLLPLAFRPSGPQEAPAIQLAPAQ
jgi:hypothetical protein